MTSDVWIRTAPVASDLGTVDATEVRAFHRRLPDYRSTPLLPLPAVARSVGVSEVWLKYEHERLGLPSFKILGASWAVYRALARELPLSRTELDEAWHDLGDLQGVLERARTRPTLVTATDGNHGRAVARMAALLGLRAEILVPTGTSAPRIDAIAGEGASVEVVAGDYDRAVAVAAARASETRLVISDTAWPGYEEIPGWISEGYSTIFDEVDEHRVQHEVDEFDVVLVPIGVGALALAVLRHFVPRGVRIVGVEPVGAACVTRSLQADTLTTVPGPHTSIMAGLNCGTPSHLAWPAMRDGLHASLTVGDSTVEAAMRTLAEGGVVAGETGAATVAALMSLRELDGGVVQSLGIGPATRVLALCTESATDPENFATVVGVSPDQVGPPRDG